jgi:hypothetical protein
MRNRRVHRSIEALAQPRADRVEIDVGHTGEHCLIVEQGLAAEATRPALLALAFAVAGGSAA